MKSFVIPVDFDLGYQNLCKLNEAFVYPNKRFKFWLLAAKKEKFSSFS